MNNRPHNKNPDSSPHDRISKDDEKWMERALVAAMDAATREEVPVGAVAGVLNEYNIFPNEENTG